MRISLILMLFAGSLAVAGCGDAGAGAGEGGAVRVVATTTQVGDLVRNVGGARADVKTMLRPNTDPHEYEPRPSDARALADAKVVFRSGGDLDDWLTRLARDAGAGEVVTLIDSVDTIEGDGEVDPHWWHDPRNAEAAVRAIEAALVQADPGGREEYRQNASAYVTRIRQLDGAIERCVDAVPAKDRKIVTTHDALGYFARRYGIEVIGSVTSSLSTQAHPSAGDTARLVDQIRAEGVNVLFAERSVSSKLEKAIATETGARVGRALWADTLGPGGSSGATYLASMAANAGAMVEGFNQDRQSCPT